MVEREKKKGRVGPGQDARSNGGKRVRVKRLDAKKKSRKEERGGQRKAGAADRLIQTAQIGPGG